MSRPRGSTSNNRQSQAIKRALDLRMNAFTLVGMSKFFLVGLAVLSMPMLSCTNTDTAAKPLQLESGESDLPWNRPLGPEGGGPLGAVLNR